MWYEVKRDRFEEMIGVYDEVCEGSFSWFSGFRNIVISMDPQMFKLSFVFFLQRQDNILCSK